VDKGCGLKGVVVATKKPVKRSMTDEHKASLAQGRNEGRAVRRYLEALATNAPRRGRKRTMDSVDRRLGVIDEELATADPLRRLKLVQERRDLQAERESMSEPIDLEGLEAEFVEVAASYSARQGIAYLSWREVGVPASVLGRAGISRSQ
jgi:hypothetical protein